MDPETMKTRAETVAAMLETAKRDNGETFYRFREGSPEWTQRLTFAAHEAGDILPDDYRYAFMRDALDAIVEAAGDEDDAREMIDGQVSIYNHELCAWLASHGVRPGYVDQATEDYGPADGIMRAIARGQLLEREETFAAVWQWLETDPEEVFGDEDETEDDEA